MKKKYIYSSAAALLLSVVSYQAGLYHNGGATKDDNRVAYVGEKKQAGKKKDIITDTKNMSPDEVSAKEGINAEQIVVKITDQGYVTSHGDHYHYYNGKVPFDAIISEELIIKDSNYVFNQADVVNEVKDGYIIKKDGQYYLYLKDATKTTNVRTKEEIARQQESSGTSRPSHQGGRSGSGNGSTGNASRQTPGRTGQTEATAKPYTTDDGYVFSPTDVIDDLGDGFLVPHGDHFHFIPKKDLSSGELTAAQAYWDKKSGKPAATNHASSNQQGQQSAGNTHAPARTQASNHTHANQPIYTVAKQPAGGSQATPSNQPAATSKPSSPAPNHQPEVNTPVYHGEHLSDLLQQLYAQPLSNRHVEADGLVFDPVTITKRTDAGVVVPHGDHFHFIPFSHMTELEAKISRIIPIGQEQPAPSQATPSVTTAAPAQTTPSATPTKPVLAETPVTPKKPVVPETTAKPVAPTITPATIVKPTTSQPVANQPYTTDDGYVFVPTDVIEDLGDGFLVPHGDHFHFIPKGDLSADELAAANAYWANKNKVGTQPNQPTPVKPDTGSTQPVLPNQPAQPEKPTQPAKPTQPEKPEKPTQPAKPAPQEETLADLLKQLYAQPLSNRHVEGDGLVFDPVTITKRTAAGVVVPHGDHFHFIPFSHMTELEAKISKLIVIGENPLAPETGLQPTTPEKPAKPAEPDAPAKPEKPGTADKPETPAQPTSPTEDDNHDDHEHSGPVDLLGRNIKKSPKGMDGLPYTTSDGYTFTAESILEYDDQGLRAEHGDHEHYIFFHELEDSELEAAQNYINREHLTAIKPSTYSKAEIEAKLRYISLENGVAYDLLIVTGNEVIIPHGNHSHLGNLDNYPVALRLADYHDLDEYRNLLIGLKMSHLRLQDGVRSAYRRNDVVVVVNHDGSEREVKLETVKLDLDYEEVDYSGLVTAVDPNEDKLAYIAKQYGVPRDHVRVLFDNLVMVEDHGAVNLDLVDVTDDVIYTLRDRKEEPKPEDKKETTSAPEPIAPVAGSSRADVIAHLGHHYGAAAEQVTFMPTIGYVIVPSAGGENVIITEDLAKASLTDPSLLPDLVADAKDRDEAPTDKPTEEIDPVDKQPTIPATPRPDKQPEKPVKTERERLIEHLTKHYGKAAELVSFVPRIGFVIVPVSGEENVIISEDVAKASLTDPSRLPVLTPAEEEERSESALPLTESNSLAEDSTNEEATVPTGDEEELDDYDKVMLERAHAFGMDVDLLEDFLLDLAMANGVSLDNFQYHPQEGTVSFIDRSGKRQIVRVPSH